MHKFWMLFALIAGFMLPAGGHAGDAVELVCPSSAIQPALAGFEPGGIILTSFDKAALWVYDLERAARYPLPDTAPCTGNCRLSPDAKRLTYFNGRDRTISMMRLNGTGRRALVRGAMDAEWWSDDWLLVWTASSEVYLQSLNDPTIREALELDSLFSVQPGGYWALRLMQMDEAFQHQLVNLQDAAQFLPLTTARAFFNHVSWSPNGDWLAFVGAGPFDASTGASGAEIYAVSPDALEIVQWTSLSANYGAVRINGHNPFGLSWSPDGTQLAFWVMELFGSSFESDIGPARIHILDTAAGRLRAYCGFATDEHTPNPPALVWSPDGSHLAFAGNIRGDDKGYLLLAMDLASGHLTELSDGLYPNFGAPDVIAWGHRP